MQTGLDQTGPGPERSGKIPQGRPAPYPESPLPIPQPVATKPVRNW